MVEREEDLRRERPDANEAPLTAEDRPLAADPEFLGAHEAPPPVGEPAPRVEEATHPADAPRARDQDFPGLGAQVAGVFTAAERAAQQMLAMAQEEVDDLRRRARAEMDSLRARRLSQAEEEARTIVAQAEAEARRIREAAQNAVWELEDSARRRVEHVVADARVLEERVEWARDGLRDVVARLHQISSERGSADEREEPPGEDRRPGP